MFIKTNQCPICDAPWNVGAARCKDCGSVAEIYFERPLPKAPETDEEKILQRIEAARKFLIEHENHGVAHYTLALAYINLGLLPEGLTELRRATQLLPEKLQIAYEAVAVAVKQGDFSDDILHQLERIIERRPSFKEALYLKGYVLNHGGMTAEAIPLWQEAYVLDSDYSPARLALERFIKANVDKLTDPQVVSAVRHSGLSKKELAYLDLFNWPGMEKPRELGVTSMRVLESFSPAKARKMQRMYEAHARQYQEVEEKRAELTRNMEQDLLSLSTLCLSAQEANLRIRREMASRAGQSARVLTIAERSAILDRAVIEYQKSGYQLVARTDTTAQLTKNREFSCCLAVILVFLVIGIILYLLWYLTAKKEDTVFLEVDQYGKLHTTYT